MIYYRRTGYLTPTCGRRENASDGGFLENEAKQTERRLEEPRLRREEYLSAERDGVEKRIAIYA